MATSANKPCPFCGTSHSPGDIAERAGGFVVYCRACSAEGPWADGNQGADYLKRKAIRLWNARRAPKR